MSNDTKRIERRIAGRRAAVDISQLLDKRDSSDPDFMAAFCEMLAPVSAEPVQEDAPEPIGRLGNTEIPFGQYKGKVFDDAPLDYLDWLCREQETFYKALRAYLKHPDLESRRRGL